MTKTSNLYNNTGTEYQHHLQWLVVLGLFETAYIKEDYTKDIKIKWLLRVMINGKNI